jgi:hypothetical protein
MKSQAGDGNNSLGSVKFDPDKKTPPIFGGLEKVQG